MRKLLTAALMALGLVAAAPVAAEAANGYTTGDVNMRAGPGTQYPRILVITRGTPVTIHGCLEGYSWCDVSVWRERGWVSSRYLDAFYNGPTYQPYRPRVRLPIISFNFGYWDQWYYDRPWYHNRPIRPRPIRPGESVHPMPDDWQWREAPNDPRENPPNWRERPIRPGAFPERNDDRDQVFERPRRDRDDVVIDRGRSGASSDSSGRSGASGDSECVMVDGECILPRGGFRRNDN